jgi:hypothetical protein
MDCEDSVVLMLEWQEDKYVVWERLEGVEKDLREA